MVLQVFLLDDHEITRRGLRELIEREPDMAVVGESGSAREAATRIPALGTDVALLDARLPDGSGIAVCREVRSLAPSVACLILTSYDGWEALSSAVLAGAAGYLIKDIRGTDLIGAVRRAGAGESLIDAGLRQRLASRWDQGGGADPRVEVLTPQERRILALVAEGLTNRQIAQRMSLAEKTVKNYVSVLLAKLGVERRTQAAVLATNLRRQGPLGYGDGS